MIPSVTVFCSFLLFILLFRFYFWRFGVGVGRGQRNGLKKLVGMGYIPTAIFKREDTLEARIYQQISIPKEIQEAERSKAVR